MANKSKPYSKKGKAATVMMSTALISAPFLMDVSNVAYADPIPKPDTYFIDKIGNLTVPLHGTNPVRNLMMIYGVYNNSSFHVTSTNTDLAYNEQGYSREGLLKIHPLAVGTATFTVSYNLYGESYQDTFDVTVVDDTTTTEERNFDISDVVKSASSRITAESLLSGIGPMNSTGNMVGNNPPILKSPNPFHDYIMEIGTFIKLDTNELTSFFQDVDSNDQIFAAVFENKDYLVEEEPEEPAAMICNRGGEDGWVIQSLSEGSATFTVAAVDIHGGVVATVPFRITVTGNRAPDLRTTNPVVVHLAQAGNTLNVSSNSELNLDELFYDTTDTSLQYQAVIENDSFPSGSPITINIMSSHLTLSDLEERFPNNSDPFTVTRLIAMDDAEASTEMDVNIVFDENNTFNTKTPNYINLFESNAEGVSTYTINPSIHWLDAEKSFVNIMQKPIQSNPTVAATVNSNGTITFRASEDATVYDHEIFHIISKSNDTVWYQNDVAFNFNPPPYSTIYMSSLYPNVEMPWASISENFYDFVSISSNSLASVTDATYVNYHYYPYTGLSISLGEAVNPGQGILFTIDPDADNEDSRGTRVYTIPFIKPNVGL